VRVFNFNEINQKDIVLVDFSWLMYRSFYSLNNLSFMARDGVCPSGHIFGSVKTILQIQELGYTVVLCLDSKTQRKKNINYKAKREAPTYNIFKDLNIILTICTFLPNVYYIKEDGFEADDIINSIIQLGGDPIVYANDNDLLQSNLPFRFSNSLNSEGFNFIDKREYINKKYGIDLNFLPVWYKVIKGDKSDNIPIAVKYLPQEILSRIVVECQDTTSWIQFETYIEKWTDDKGKLIKGISAMKENYDMVIPFIMSENIPVKKMGHSWSEVLALLNYTQMNSLKDGILNIPDLSKGG
jgi:hypothetical protein